jgi:hypothetical protein
MAIPSISVKSAGKKTFRLVWPAHVSPKQVFACLAIALPVV